MRSGEALAHFVERHRELLTALAESGTRPVDNLRALVRGIQPHEWPLVWLVHEALARCAAPSSMRCFFCQGAAHPASGAQYTATAVACGPCVRSFWAAHIQRTYKRWGGLFFYDYARAPAP